ncbi:MAG: flavin reductase family protein [Fidelibacterota bacterium]
MIFDPSDHPYRKTYHLMTSLIVPRPIAWISTVSADGVINLAPYSYFTGISSNPPVLAVSIARRRDKPHVKDTLANIRDTGFFAVNSVPVSLGNSMAVTAQDEPPETDEFSLAGLTPISCEKISCPRIKESPASMECKMLKWVDVGENHPGSSVLILGEILLFHLDDGIMDGDRINLNKLDPLGRLNNNFYTRLTEIFEL